MLEEYARRLPQVCKSEKSRRGSNDWQLPFKFIKLRTVGDFYLTLCSCRDRLFLALHSLRRNMVGWLFLTSVSALYICIGLAVGVIRWFTEFTRIHYELEPGNLGRGLPIEKHVELVQAKMKSEKRWYDNALLEILFWPLYLLFMKKKFWANFVRGLQGLHR